MSTQGGLGFLGLGHPTYFYTISKEIRATVCLGGSSYEEAVLYMVCLEEREEPVGLDELRDIRTRCLAASGESRAQHEVLNRTGVFTQICCCSRGQEHGSPQKGQ